ncbi:Hypothetical protein LUCI_4454 [Lucifera butyrica]|uniref:Uncharacterized protein n=1 Tax=Lucifera butyrica TaxID=1351585 RepID=A0A498RJH1_9FIRM|nr:Hypothetical protein LUCI_4454 [Lucifera butyrica]
MSMANYNFILCKNFTKSGVPISKTTQFTLADPFIVSLVILDNLEPNSEFTIETVWKYKTQVLFHHKKKFRVAANSICHRFESFIKMAQIEYKKMYGSWNVSLIINGNEASSLDFIVTNPMTNYGNNNCRYSNNSIINISF